MIKHLLWSVLFSAATALAVCAAEAGENPSPRIKLQSIEFDGGSVIEGDSVQHDFVVFNEGDAPLEIQKVAPG